MLNTLDEGDWMEDERGKYRKRGKEESEDHERKRHNLVQVVNRMKREKMDVCLLI